MVQPVENTIGPNLVDGHHAGIVAQHRIGCALMLDNPRSGDGCWVGLPVAQCCLGNEPTLELYLLMPDREQIYLSHSQ